MSTEEIEALIRKEFGEIAEELIMDADDERTIFAVTNRSRWGAPSSVAISFRGCTEPEHFTSRIMNAAAFFRDGLEKGLPS